MRVIIESPFSGGDLINVEYARRCLMDSLQRGESPFASHLLYTQVLDDRIPEQREMGMGLALPWYEVAEMCAVYIDRGVSAGMASGIQHAVSLNLKIVERTLEDDDSQTDSGNGFKSYWRR
tara:strand:+ start:1598 stop:1960 length:363 start_codon:yes stop_codon:yes gene_type:complete